ncbi:MAG: hypothetical protein CMG75_01950 [Candidatus Marinimicrobia bacterium]|nr:hypothetical protein [Candidatus Neomarinimicrobiota bacterium]|tara:strand:+ start:25353 stop:26468 length:1116 start_codon:yes stop_codon:yes gene_type:complete
MTKYSVFRLEEWFEKYEFNVDHNLGSSSCARMTIDDFFHITGKPLDFRNISLNATPGAGSEELRKEISLWYNKGSINNIYITSSSTEAIFLLIESLLSEGDSLIAMFPMYPALYQLALDKKIEVRYWNLEHSNKFKPDFDDLIKLIDDSTKLILINNPQNPTGQILLYEDLKYLSDFSKKYGIQLWVDEVFRGITIDGGPVTPSIRDIDESSIATGSMSKSFGLSGLRIGWISAPKKIIHDLYHIRFYTTVSAPILEQKIATEAHRNREKIFFRNQTIINNNYDYLKAWMVERQDIFHWIKPKGGPVTFPKFIPKIKTDEFCKKLVEEKSVLLVPGNYAFFSEGFIRIGYGESQNFEEGMSRISKILNDIF